MIKKILGGLRKEFFSIEGRASRSQFIGGIFLCYVIFGGILVVPAVLFENSTGETSSIFDLFFGIIFIFSCIAGIIGIINIRTKRCHDLGNSGWFQLIPIYSPFFLLFARGTIGNNRFGIDPIQEHEDWIKEIKSGKKPIKKSKSND